MRLIIFGLTVSSSWGNGHATLWRGLVRALALRGHQVSFFERDAPYYAQNRDLSAWTDGALVLYSDWNEVQERARSELKAADLSIITSFCPDAQAASDLIQSQEGGLKIFYDLDTPVTLAEYLKNGRVNYIPRDGLAGFDLVLSFTGGLALTELTRLFGARKTATMYGHADPGLHHPSGRADNYRADLSYFGTFASDRQPALEKLLILPARQLPKKRFTIGGALYPDNFHWAQNIYFVRHLPPSEHSRFFSSSSLTLNITRPSMAAMGFCPSGRLFEAACCQTPILSDLWPGIEEFFEPGKEILLAKTSKDVTDCLSYHADALAEVGLAGRRRVLAQHTADHRAQEFERLVNNI